jgi:low affinity Fe/Cu permease
MAAQLPSHADDDLSLFDRFADRVNSFSSRAWFFAACTLLVIIWVPSFLFVGSIDTWQLLINTPTTVITFLLVALQQNANSRSDSAMHQKLNAIASGVADLLDDGDVADAMELREAVGLEQRESSGD